MADAKEILSKLAAEAPRVPSEPSQEVRKVKPTGKRAVIEFVEDGPRGVVARVTFEGLWKGADLALASRALNRDFRHYLVSQRKGS